SVELQLVPRSLGVVEVRIVQQNGQLNVSIQTQTAEAANLLKAETNVIKQMLHNAGIVVDEYSVNLNSHLEQTQPGSRSMRDPEGGSAFQNFEANKNGSDESAEFNGSERDANEQASVLRSSVAEAENEELRDPTGLYL
ncbi:MAG: flagellar hook-length control protein FliK, partial [Pseudomonadota bacterium]